MSKKTFTTKEIGDIAARQRRSRGELTPAESHKSVLAGMAKIATSGNLPAPQEADPLEEWKDELYADRQSASRLRAHSESPRYKVDIRDLPAAELSLAEREEEIARLAREQREEYLDDHPDSYEYQVLGN